MTDGVMAFDERGQLIHVNTAAYDMLEIDDLNISFKWLLKKLGLKLKDIKQDSIYEMTVNENGKYISTSIISYSVQTLLQQFYCSCSISCLLKHTHSYAYHQAVYA